MPNGLKTVPYQHQRDAFDKARLRPAFANFSDQGTGKTWSSIAEIFALYELGLIDRVMILAPKGVDSNWINIEIPRHAPDVDMKIALWRPQKTKKKEEEIRECFLHDGLKIFAMNWDAIRYERAFKIALWFLERGDPGAMIIGDESQRIKTPSAKTTRAALKLAKHAAYRRILSGTPSPQGPFDLFSQFQFLDSQIIDTNSFITFKARHAELAGKEDYRYRHIFDRIKTRVRSRYPKASEDFIERMAKKQCPQVVKVDSEGRPIYRNIEKLRDMIEPHSFRVEKDECLDLPEKIQTQRFYELTSEQRRVYNELKYRSRLLFDDDTILPLTIMTAMQKMAQVCSGFFHSPDEGIVRIDGKNPKMEVFREELEDLGGKQAIVWGVLRAELQDIEDACRDLGISFGSFHGGVNDEDRDRNKNAFQAGDKQIFIGQPQAAGRGLTLTAAERVFYYSNSYNLEHRLQTEDRAHRIGQKKHVVYRDFIAENSIEIQMIKALQSKADLSTVLMGDQFRRHIFED